MAISDQLREAFESSELTAYRIAKESKIPHAVLSRWLSGNRANIRLDTVDALCKYFGLELRPIKRRRQTKPAGE